MPDEHVQARPWMAALAALLLGVALTAAGANWQAQRNAQRATHALEEAAREVVASLSARMGRYEYGLRGARGALVAVGQDRLRRADFARYHATRDLLREFPGAHGFGFIRRVPEADRAAYEVQAAADGWPGFAVRTLQPHDGHRYVIQYIEPVAENRAAVGLDIASERHRREAADQAMRTGEATITAPITLVQATGQPRRGFLVLLPWYRAEGTLDTAQARERALVGWAYVPLVIDEVVGDLLSASPMLRVTIRDAQADATDAPFFATPGAAEVASGGLPELRSRQRLFGREWEFGVSAAPGFAEHVQPIGVSWVIVGGMLASALLAALAAVMVQARQRGAQVREAQVRVAALAAGTSDAVISETLEGRVTDWNRAAEQIFGWRAEEAIGQPLAQLIGHPESTRTNAEILRMARAGEDLSAFDTVRQRRDGTSVDVSIAAHPVVDAAGRLIGVGKIVRDISRRRALERELQALTSTLEVQVVERTRELESARHDLRTILDALPSMVGYWDRGLVNRFANRAYSRWFGVDPGQLPGRHMRELLGESLLELNRAYVDGALRGEPQTFERIIPFPDGTGSRHALTHYLPDVVDGEVRGFYTLVHDVSDLTRSRQELATALHALATERQRLSDSEAFLERAERVAGVGGWQFDVGSQTLRWTAQTRRIHEVDDDFVPTHDNALAFYPPPAREELRARIANATATGDPWDLELPFTTAKGRSIWVRAMGEVEWAQRGDAPVVVRLTGALQDVTARRQAEQGLRRLQAAEESSRHKSAFLATMSHEMRTPLNAVIGFMQLLARTPLNREQNDLVARVASAGQALLAVINDVLDLSKIEAGQLDLHREVFNLRALLRQVGDMLAPTVASKGLDWSVQVDPALPDRLVGDGARLRQVLTNLLGNAVKFTERGSVRLKVDVQERSEDQVVLAIEVIDTGIGMDADTQSRLFEPFMQADSTTTRRFGGTGLGLSIVGRLLDGMGGAVQVHSVLGEGTRFCVQLPLDLAGALDEPGDADDFALLVDVEADHHRWLEGVRVLVVDDSVVNREVVSRLLADEGAEVQLAADGLEALAAVRRAAGALDVVLMDLQMPGIDGHEACRRIQADAAGGALPVVALTAALMQQEEARARAAGMSGFVAKPIQRDRLLLAVRRALADGGRPVPAPVARPAPLAQGVAHEALAPVDGVDLAQALRGLNHDQDLLARMLDHLIEEFTPLAATPEPIPDGLTGAVAAQALQRRLHKLQGSAGSVGASGVAAAAAAAQDALRRAPGSDEALQALKAVAMALQHLMRQAPAWRSWAVKAETRDDGAVGDPSRDWTRQAQSEMLTMLRQQDLAAIELARSHARELQRLYGPSAWMALDAALGKLDFAQAARQVQDMAPLQ